MGTATFTIMKKSKRKTTNSPLIENRKARHDYFLMERMEAGISLKGHEVKSIREVRNIQYIIMELIYHVVSFRVVLYLIQETPILLLLCMG